MHPENNHISSCVPVATSDDPTSKPNRIYPRAPFHDYNGGRYFITVCTKEMAHFFGKIFNNKMILSPLGETLEMQLSAINTHYSDVEIPLYVVMPNHFHAVVVIKSSSDTYLKTADNIGRLNQKARLSLAECADPIFTTHHSCRLGNIVASIKAGVTRFARKNNIEFAWQSRYHDHIIRGNHDGNTIAAYIENNVANWRTDCFFNEM